MIAVLELGQADEFPDNRFADEGECARHLISPLSRTRRT
jgi:hypothetical protein